MSDYDVIVIGSGAGGSIAAWKMATSGKRVLVLERGKTITSEERDLLRNHRYARFGHNTGPDLVGNPRTLQGLGGRREILNPIDGGYNNNAMAVGGGTVVYGAQAWRFHPLDFKMASTYGVPEGSSLADWPLDYDELAPYYEEVEHLIGISGGPPSPNLPSRREYPMPPLPLHRRGEVLQEAADRLGWGNQRVPLMVNSEPYKGRPACLGCGMCVGFVCPNGSRADMRTTLLRWAEETGRLEVWPEAFVEKVLANSSRVATGVRCRVGGEVREITADWVVVAAGAIESARLLFLSATPESPNGLGNQSDHLGRNLQGHFYPGAIGLFKEPINPEGGPGPSVSVTQFNHGNDGIVGGGMLADDFGVIPSAFAANFRPEGVPAHGPELKEFMRHHYRRCFNITGPVQDIPDPSSRVRLDPSVVDGAGLPVAMLSGVAHNETIRTARFMQEKAIRWFQEAGAEKIWSRPQGRWLSAGQHQAGTCRMSHEPEDGVVDAMGRVHGHDNLLVCDTSVHVTNGGFNPFLTAMAVSLRTAALNFR